MKEPAQIEIKNLGVELENCSTPYQIRNTINKERYFLSEKCLTHIRKRLLQLMGKSLNPYDNELYDELYDELDERIKQAKEKQQQIKTRVKKEKAKRVVHHIENDDGIEITTPDLKSDILHAVNRHLFIKAYNLFKGNSYKISIYLGMSLRNVTIWKRKYVKNAQIH